MFDEIQQIKKLADDSRHILIVFNRSENTDALSAALALSYCLQKNNKSVDIACPDFIAPKNVNFLENVNTIQSELKHLRKLILKVDVSQTKIESISYDIKDNWLSIYLTPKNGLLTKDELRTAQSSYKYDLIITLNTTELESFGKIFLNNTDLFYRTPIINIDHNPANEHYGQINFIDLNSTSVSEITYQLIKQIWETHLNEKSATPLLTGMIAATHSFKTTNVTPLTLQIASELINHGADREKIIQNLYRMRSLAALKLWGRALTKLKIDPVTRFAWTIITQDDFSISGAGESELQDIIDELISNSPEIDLTLLIYELQNKNGQKITNAILHSKKGHDMRLLLKGYNPSGTKQEAKITIPDSNLLEVEKQLIEQIKKSLN